MADNELQKNITEILKNMLSKNCVDAVLVPKKLPFGNQVVQSLISDEKQLEDAQPISPVMPVNSGTILSNMTKVAPSEKTVAVVLKPCEIRAAVELVKLKQASFENIIIIGLDCPGTYSVNYYKEFGESGESPLDDLKNNLAQGKDDANIRSACKVCEYPTPENADIILGYLGSDLKSPIILANSDKGKDILNMMDISPLEESKERDLAKSKLIERRKTAWLKLVDVTQKEVGGLDNLLSFFETCIKCHNCMDVCPVCYCRECFFDSPTFDYEAQRYLSWSKKKGIIKMPKDTLIFHLTRMNHMATSCVGCGMCEQACPSKIELLKLYKTVGYNAQKVFDYVPGRSVDEQLPLLVFREEELDPR